MADLLHAARKPRDGQNRRTHYLADAQADRARCGAALAGIVAGVEDPADTTCCACRAALHRAGVLPYVRARRP